MRVLYLISGIGPKAGWGTEFIQNLIFELNQKGLSATIISPIYLHTPANWRQWINEENRKQDLKIIPVEFPFWIKQNLFLSLLMTPLFVTHTAIILMKKYKFDFVHEFSSTPIILFRSLFFKLFFRTPTIFTLSVFNNSILGNAFWFRIFDFAKFYLIPSKEIIKKMRFLKIDQNKIMYTQPLIYPKNLCKLPSKHSSRRQLGLPQKKLIVLFFGSLTKEKGVQDLINAALILKKSYKNRLLFCCYVIWKGAKEHDQFKLQIQNIDNSYFRLNEGLIDIPLILSSSDVVLLPQQTGHGATLPILSVLETIMAGKLLITTNIIGNRELINHHNGLLIPPKDPVAIALAIKKVLSQRLDINVKPNKGFLEKWNYLNIVDQYYNLYYAK